MHSLKREDMPNF